MTTQTQTVTIERHDWDDDLSAITFASADADTPHLPLAFMLHGLNSRRERHLTTALDLAAAGFRAVLVDARFHGDRWDSHHTPALYHDRHSLDFLVSFVQVVQGTAADIARVASDLGGGKYGVIGHSMGGLIALQTALVDPNVAAVANIAGSIEMRPPPGITLPPALLALAQPVDPFGRAGEFFPAATLLLHGADDDTVPVEWAKRLFALMRPSYTPDPDRLKLEVFEGIGHEYTPAMAHDAVAWLRRWIPAP